MSESKQTLKKPRFRNEDEEARWWASAEGRAFLRSRSATESAAKGKGSALVSRLGEKRSVQIAIRLPALDIEKARQIAERKGIRYQTLLKMLVHEGLERETRRK